MGNMSTTMVGFFVFLISVAYAHEGHDPCTLEPDPGPCRAKTTRYFFNPETKRCESFIYGGCRGVVPFETLRRCEKNCDPCRQKPETGPCEARLKRYFFHKRRGTCEPFFWGGCDGTVPFEDLQACERENCTPEEKPLSTPKPLRPRCDLEPERGPCLESKTRWFWDAAAQMCKPFEHSGCFGRVPFRREEQCILANCAGDDAGDDDMDVDGDMGEDRKPDVVGEEMPDDMGGNVPGDMGSEMPNNMGGDMPGDMGSEMPDDMGDDMPDDMGDDMPDDMGDDMPDDMGDDMPDDMGDDMPNDMGSDKPEDMGGDKPDDSGSGDGGGRKAAICRATPDPGPCKGQFPRWFYNPDTDSCESFIYGGCKGSAPFATRAECEAASCVQNRCTLEPERGPCDKNITAYFFNQGTGKCDSFSHGGCFGVIPFKTLASCTESSCSTKTNNCGLLPSAGPCDKNETRYWYDNSRGECTSFLWGGCGGVVPFESKTQCEAAGCVRDPCKLVPETGVCRAFFRRYFWNQEFKRCEGFTWGGCGGVVPFETEMECEEALCAGADFGNNNDDDLSRI